jgi:hypothetical protein
VRAREARDGEGERGREGQGSAKEAREDARCFKMLERDMNPILNINDLNYDHKLSR